jgi:hypothetical protein
VRALEAQVEALKKRIEVLEGGQAAAPTPSSSARAACAGDRLKMSMTQAEVRAILGEPAKIDTTPLQTRWRYGCGSAYFDAGTRLFVGFERAR